MFIALLPERHKEAQLGHHAVVGLYIALSRSVPAKLSQFGEALRIKVSGVAGRLQRRRERLYRSTA
jgi:hypothetical protein